MHVGEMVLLSKALRPLPIVKTKVDETTGVTTTYDAFTDPELRYRQRYVDLVVNPEYKSIFVTRASIVSEMRKYFEILSN